MNVQIHINMMTISHPYFTSPIPNDDEGRHLCVLQSARFSFSTLHAPNHLVNHLKQTVEYVHFTGS